MSNKKVAGRQPPRLRVLGELGQLKTMAPDHVLHRRGGSRNWLVLGLGPDPAGLAAMLPPGAEVAWIDSPDFLAQAGPDFLRAVPGGWQRLETIAPGWSGNLAVSPGAERLFPSFWGPILASLALPEPDKIKKFPRKTALVPSAGNRLITRELTEALASLGYNILNPPSPGLAELLKEGRPDLFLSVNFQGLDDYGRDFTLLARAGVPAAVWCVDNPFQALSGLKSPFWRQIQLFVTDDWFVPVLKEHGAQHVHHLPLAASQGFFQAIPIDSPGADILFVGRSQFPGKKDFFAGLKPPEDLWQQALSLMETGQRPDFAWWAGKLGLTRFWPGKEARLAGLGAEECGRTWRAKVLTSAAQAGELSVYGDDDWQDLVPGPLALHPPVDYYGPLAGMYAKANFTLACTSPLLPRGLTQRHFDVWAAGGFLLCDHTNGLDIFPEELTSPIVFRRASEVPDLVAKFKANPSLRTGLIEDWRALMGERHTYEIRVKEILACLGLDQ